MTPVRKIFLVASALLFLAGTGGYAQDEAHFRKILHELSSARYQGRGYARDGVIKAGEYIAEEYRKAGADEVSMQPFSIDINTFPGDMKMSVDGRRLKPGEEFTVREYSPGFHGRAELYYIDTLHYDADLIFSDLQKPENAGCFVVCDFWFIYRHKDDFHRMESKCELQNAGMIYVWDTPLKFYKAYGEKVVDKPVLWVSSDFPRNAKTVKVDIDNEFRAGYVSNNVIARIEGERHDSCFVFTAHYDHLGNMGRKLYFPGANDNASGTAALITLAEYYAKDRPQYDMYFISLSGEEANLRGSNYFVEHPTMPLSSIRYLFNLDMIGDDNPVQYCEVSESGQRGYRDMLALNTMFGYFEDLHQGELAANSDHWPFACKGVPCILFENESGSAFPYYHTAHDNMKTARVDTYAPLMKLITHYIAFSHIFDETYPPGTMYLR